MLEMLESFEDWNKTLLSQTFAAYYFTEGVTSYGDDFLKPLLEASEIFAHVELLRMFERSPAETVEAYCKLYNLNVDLFSRYGQGTLKTLGQYNKMELNRFYAAWFATMLGLKGEKLSDYFTHHEGVLKRVLDDYPQAILDIEPEYGFHFENDPDSVVAETERFTLHRVLPCEKGVEVDKKLKPVIIIPPFVLGANILSFLPGQGKSYAHSFANKSIPTYIRVIKPIHQTEAVQVMTLEDDAEDTRFFCEKIKIIHGKSVTLNGYCQGGFSSVCNMLSGKLDGLVDALITCVAPMDGTRSKGLATFLKALPPQFNQLDYGTKKLANGNRIASGDLMGWIYKLKSIENSGPMIDFFRDIMMLSHHNGSEPITINKTVAAINYWLQNERSDLPLSVTDMSFRSYNYPVSEDGTLPIEMFGKKLNFNALKEKNVSWLLCLGETDDLVEKEVALAPKDFLDVEVSVFPKGHVAIATSWSHPNSKCALHTRFGEENYRGPVRFQLDLDGIED